MDFTLGDRDWDVLVRNIKMGRCTPFVGAEAAAGALPPRSQIAQEWARDYHYPLEDRDDLARVAQFMATQDVWWPKDEIIKRLAAANPPDFLSAYEPHVVLASLSIQVYITTNYSDFMFQAIESRKEIAPFKEPVRDLCRWDPSIRNRPELFTAGHSPSEAKPLVYHLFGHVGAPESLVVTEDDYLDYLVNTSMNQKLIPSRVQEAFSSGALLFMGYRLEDLEFRVLLRSLVSYLKNNKTRPRVWVQQVPAEEAMNAGGIIKRCG